MTTPAWVILAAGRSTRMGEPKALVTIDGTTLLEWQLAQLAQATPEAKITVVVPRSEVGDRIVARTAPNQRVRFVRADSEAKPFASLRAAVETRADVATFVTPIDVPIAPSVATALWAAYRPETTEAVRPSDGKRAGHPVLLSPKFLSRLLRLDVATARLDLELQQVSAEALAYVVVAAAEPFLNLNTPEALESYRLAVTGATTRVPRR